MNDREEILERNVKILNKNQKILNDRIIKQNNEIIKMKRIINYLNAKIKYNEELLIDILLTEAEKQLANDVNKLLEQDDG